jgi:hypothetical protein
MTAEEYFDSIYTYHANDYVRMPLNELYELMEGYLKAQNKALNIADVVGRSEQLCQCYMTDDTTAMLCKNCNRSKREHGL